MAIVLALKQTHTVDYGHVKKKLPSALGDGSMKHLAPTASACLLPAAHGAAAETGYWFGLSARTLRLAGAALLSIIATHSGEATTRKSTDTGGVTVIATTATENSIGTAAWFSRLIGTLPEYGVPDLQKMEQMVENQEVPLSLQIDFLEHALRSGGVHYRELHDERLSLERFSGILKLASTVSNRLTIAYENAPNDPLLRQYFNIEALKKASGYIFANLAAPGNAHAGAIFCNGFFLREGNDAYIGTAAHCVKGTTAQKHFFFPEGHADTAIQYVPPSRYAEHRISDPNDLPDLRKSTTPESASGRVVASYSWATGSPDTRKVLPRDMKRKLHFSFAMPLPPIARRHIGRETA